MRTHFPSRLRFQHIALLVSATLVLTLVVSGAVTNLLRDPPSLRARRSCVAEGFPYGMNSADYVYLFIYVDPAKNQEFYSPANFTVPSHTLVHFEITDYDTGSSRVNSSYGQVCGVVNDTMTVNGVPVSSWDTSSVAHTFTITNGTYRGFNVPIPPSPGIKYGPTVVVFSAYFNDSGVYRWQCEANCGETQMSLDGMMSGLLTVE